MKKYIYILFASLGLLTSCEEDLVIFDEGDGFISNEVASASTAEDGGPMSTTISLGTGSNESGVSVNFDVVIESGDASRFNITPSNGVLEIPAGEFSGEIVVEPIDNIDADGNVVIRVELSESNALPVGTAGLGLERTTTVFTITDNDCPTEISDSYSVEVFALDDEAPSHTVDFVPVPGTDNQWTIASSWGPEFVDWTQGGGGGFSGLYLYPGTIILNEDFTVDFVGDPTQEGYPAEFYPGGSGTYSACDNQFTITLQNGVFTSGFPVDIVMTGN
jgi:hypothetical protein